MKKQITVKRESEMIFCVESNFPYWSTGDGIIRERMAFDRADVLCNLTAQSIESKSGIRYMLLSPLCIGNPRVIAAAKLLSVGASVVVDI